MEQNQVLRKLRNQLVASLGKGSVSKLLTLPPEQNSKLHDYREHWLSTGRSTEPVDWKLAELAINSVYAEIGKAPPYIVQSLSPWQMCVLPGLLHDHFRFEVSSASRLWEIGEPFDSLKGELNAQLESQLSEQIVKELRQELEGWLTDRLSPQIRRLALQLDNDLYSKVRSQSGLQDCPDFESKSWLSIWSSVKSQIRSQQGSVISLQLAARIHAHLINETAPAIRGGWYPVQLMTGAIALHSFAQSHLDIKYGDSLLSKLDMWSRLLQAVHCFVPFEDVCFVSARPRKLLCDGLRLHCDDGSALEYVDGYALYCWQGVLINRHKAESIILRPNEITIDSIDTETNLEIKRVMLERYGVGRYLIESDAQLIHEDEFGKLYKMELPGAGIELTVVAVKNATPEPDGSIKEYFLQVHADLCPMLDEDGKQLGAPQALTARNAVASSFGLRGDEFWPLAES